MASISDISIIGPDDGTVQSTENGTERLICGLQLCGSKHLTAYYRTIGKRGPWSVGADGNYHLLYVIEKADGGVITVRGARHEASAGAGALLAPGETATFETPAGELNLLQLVVPPPPSAVEAGLPGGPGYFFDRSTLRALADASGGRVRRFCAESSVRLSDGHRLTPTNAIQAGEMHYKAGGASPYHCHRGTESNPDGPDHCYITFRGQGRVEVEGSSRVIAPRTLVYFPPGVPHRLSAVGGPLDYFEVQAWRSFKTTILSEEPLGLKWYYESDTASSPRVEWNQS
jgi:mannose-6-phosphate isomerase-like protein (cupin superfamily)